jgi:putative endonuclease
LRRDDSLGRIGLPEEKVPSVYLLASKRHGTLYCGVTSNLCSRVSLHKQGHFEGFSKTYNVKMLVWYATFPSMAEAIIREKQIKEWKRGWKIELIEKMNPTWRDLFEETCGPYIE